MPRARRARPPLSRNTYDLHWLTSRATRGRYRGFHYHPFREIQNSRNQIRDSLSAAIVDHHLHSERVADLIHTLGFHNTAQFIESELPQDDRTRKGNFGEVVASEHLIQRHGYHMPVFKMRFRDSHNMPMRGEDIVAFDIDDANRIRSVIIGEAKAILRYNSRTVMDAHNRLTKAYRPRPMTLSMITEILYARGDRELAREIDRISDLFMKRGYPKRNWIFLITENRPRDPFQCVEEQPRVIANLNCVSIPLADLSAFVHDLFDNPTI